MVELLLMVSMFLYNTNWSEARDTYAKKLVPTEVVQPVRHKPVVTPKRVAGIVYVQKTNEQCVQCARRLSRVKLRGNANTWAGQARANGYSISSQVSTGSVLVENHLSAAGHVSVVVQIDTDGFWVEECNYIKGWQTRRKLPHGSQRVFLL